MTKVRTGWLDRHRSQRAVSAQSGQTAITPTTMAEAIEACAVHSGKLVNNLDRKRIALAEALRQLLVAHVETPAGSGTAVSTIGRRSAKRGSQVIDALLDVGTKATACGSSDELRLARRIADAVLTERPASRAGWRLRGRLLDALGEDVAAAAAHERYVALCQDDDLGISTRVAGLRTSAEKLTEILVLLQRDCPGAQRFVDHPETELWFEGLELSERGAWEEAEPRLVAALVGMVARGGPAFEVGRDLARFIDARLADRGGRAAPSRELLGLYADYRRLREQGPVADPLMGGTEMVGVGSFRNLIAGKSICLIANSQRVGDSAMGPEIDSYDLVVRFNSFQIAAPATGTRTDIHATIHKHGYNWDKDVETRLVFGGLLGPWKSSVRNRLVPGAQRYLGDGSLRWPVRNLGKLDDKAWASIPTSGFNMLWLLDFLNVNPRIDLIGFDFYASGAYRLPSAMKHPITTVHGYLSEKEWVMERAQDVTDTRISLR